MRFKFFFVCSFRSKWTWRTDSCDRSGRSECDSTALVKRDRWHFVSRWCGQSIGSQTQIVCSLEILLCRNEKLHRFELTIVKSGARSLKKIIISRSINVSPTICIGAKRMPPWWKLQQIMRFTIYDTIFSDRKPIHASSTWTRGSLETNHAVRNPNW